MNETTTTSAFSQWRRLALKELREILRDRRTIITLVLMPLFLYPLLGGVVQKVLLSNIAHMAGGPVYILGFESEEDFRLFSQITGMQEVPLTGTETSAAPNSGQPSPGDAVAAMLDQTAEPSFQARMPQEGEGVDLEKLAADRMIDVGIRIRRPTVGEPGRPTRQLPRVRLELIHETGSRFTRDALLALERRIDQANEEWRTRLLEQAGLPTEVPIAFSVRTVDPIGRSTFSLVTFIPLALILMTVTGAVYPAIDLTAGERERGTLETLIAAPISRLRVLLAKFVAVLAVAMLTAVINLTAMLITLFAIGLDRQVFGEQGLTLGTVAIILGLLFVFAGFFSAVLLSVTSFARSFKEAQAYLIPLMLLALTPGIFSLMPDVRLNGLLAMTPLVNVVLAARDVLQGSVDPTLLLLSMGSTVVYGLLALLVAARVFGTDAIMYGSEGTWADLFARPTPRSEPASLTLALLSLILLVPAFMVMSAVAGRIEHISMNTRLMLTMLVQSLFVLVPLGLVWWNRLSIPATFRLQAPRLRAVLAAIVLGMSLWPFAYELTALTTSVSRQSELYRLFAPLKEQIAAIPLGLRLLALAIVPAVCEEWFFRGMLLTGLLRDRSESRRSQWTAIGISAALFAAFHVLVQDNLFFERFLPSCLMGLVLGWVCVQSGSLLPGIVLHTLHNGLLLSSADYQPQLSRLGLDLQDQAHLPLVWIAGAAVLVVVGLLLLPRRQQ